MGTRIKEFSAYWWNLATHSKDAFDKITWPLALLAWLLVTIFGFAKAEPIVTYIGIGIAGLLTARAVFWLPFREHVRLTGELKKLQGETHGRLIIHSADYSHGDKYEDMTQRVRSYIVEGIQPVVVNMESMGVDPKPFAHKKLAVSYSINGKQQNQVIEENQKLILSDVKSLEIKSASDKETERKFLKQVLGALLERLSARMNEIRQIVFYSYDDDVKKEAEAKTYKLIAEVHKHLTSNLGPDVAAIFNTAPVAPVPQDVEYDSFSDRKANRHAHINFLESKKSTLSKIITDLNHDWNSKTD